MDIKYVNNLGTWTFNNCVVSVSDNYEWQGRSVRKTKQLQIDGYLTREEADRWEQMLTDSADSARDQATLGSLTVPWTTLANIKLLGVSVPENFWHDLVPYSVTFADEFAGNLYELSFFGMTLHNPRLSVLLPTAECRDEYTQMQYQPGVVFNPTAVGAGVMRTKGASGLIEINLSGTIRTPDGKLPDNWLSLLTRRAGMDASSLSSLVPAGYPMPFNLSDAVPELLGRYTVNGCILSGSRLQWSVEEGIGLIQIDMLAQPQSMGVV